MAAPIRPKDLTSGTPTAGADYIFDSGTQVLKTKAIGIVDAAIPLASQAEAEAGTDNVKRVTPLRVAQAVGAQVLSPLQATTGAALVGVTGGGTVQGFINKINRRREFWLDDFGADSTGIATSDAAWAACLNAIGMAGGTLTGNAAIILGSGTYRFASKLSVTLSQAARNNFTLMGQAPNTSKMLWNGANGGLDITLTGQENAVHISDLSLLTGVAGGGTALNMTNVGAFGGGDGNSSNIVNVYIAGSDKTEEHDSGVFYWDDGAISTAVSMMNYTRVNIVGNAPTGNGRSITFQGDADTETFAVVCDVFQCNFMNMDEGWIVGSWQQGINIQQCNFTNGNRAIYQPPGTLFADQLTVAECQIDTVLDSIVIDGMVHADISSNLFFQHGSMSSIVVSGSRFVSIHGNTINGNVGGAANGTGIYVASNIASNASIVSGNILHNLTNGVFLSGGTSGWNVQGNGYSGNTNNVINSGGGANSIGVATQ